jgi:DegV family protein with EDD domain
MEGSPVAIQETRIEDASKAGSDPGHVAVVTDSTTYLPREMIERFGIHEVSLYVGWDGEMKREDSYDNLDEFYAKLRDSPGLPTTSQPSIGDFIECFEPLVSSGKDVVSVHIAGGISGTCESAREAARTLAGGPGRGRVEVVDSQSGAGGTGLQVFAAATAAEAGADLDGMVEAISQAHQHLDIWFCLDTLEFLRRGGRIGAAQAMLGTALRVKPILTFGVEITPVGRVRTRSRAMETMGDYLEELHNRGATDWIIQHIQCPDEAELLVERGTSIFETDPLFCTEVGPVIGAHLGSGMMVGGMTRPGIDPAG